MIKKSGKKKLGLWLPCRREMTSVTYETPGALIEEIKQKFVSYLSQNSSLDLVELDDFRNNLISSGRLTNDLFQEMDAFVWFGEIGRDHRGDCNLEMLKALEQKMTVINPTLGYQIAMDKFHTGMFLTKNQIPVPKFMLFTSTTVEDAVKQAERWGGQLLLKPRLGSYGIGIVKVDKPKDLTDIVDYAPTSMHYIEQFIPNDPTQWIGINMIGGKHAYSYRKEADCIHDGWKVMDRKRIGGKMILAQPTERQLAIARKISELLDMTWVGVDLITDRDGNSYVVDVNAFPGLYPEMFKLQGIDGPKMMADAIFAKLGV